MVLTWDDIEHFDDWEFDSPDLPGSGRQFMNLEFVSDLDWIRSEIGRPLIVNSGCRTPRHNKKIGGVHDSAHLTTRPVGVVAVDLECYDNGLRRDIMILAEERGINRIGIGKTFIHLDSDLTKVENRYWDYYPRPKVKIFGFTIYGSQPIHDR